MQSKTVAIAFSSPLETIDPLKRVAKKRPTYVELLRRCEEEGWKAVIVTRKTYQGNGKFWGYWRLKEDDSFKSVDQQIKVDLVYDRTGGLHFPKANDKLKVVDNRDFKLLAWDKWAQYQEIGSYMAKTVLVDRENVSAALFQLHGDFVVMKPTNGLKGLGIFIGPKEMALKFTFPDDTTPYIASDFIETKNGIPGIVDGRHDLRVVIINGKPVWTHVRIPPEGEFKANLSGRNGGTLKELMVSDLPESVLQVVRNVAPAFTEKYDNPIYSLDFGFDENGKPWVFEINDQIGFPRVGMKAKDLFLVELVKNFEMKIRV